MTSGDVRGKESCRCVIVLLFELVDAWNHVCKLPRRIIELVVEPTEGHEVFDNYAQRLLRAVELAGHHEDFAQLELPDQLLVLLF